MLILTPNRRLAAFSKDLYNQQAIVENKKCWQTPQIYPIEVWLQELWCLSTRFKPVINKTKQQILIEQIIQNSSAGVELLRIVPTAKNVIQAWTFIKQWRLDLSKVAAFSEYSIDTAAFCVWIDEYLQWLDQHDYIDFPLMVEALIDDLPNMIDKIPDHICLRGLHDISPQYQHIIKLLEKVGIKISYDQLLEPSQEVSRTSFADVTEELKAAASWAAGQKDLRIGIVVPDLEVKRQLVDNIFKEYIPAHELNISAPFSLASYQLIDTALLILQQAKSVLRYHDISILLRSPYIAGGAKDQNARARYDRLFRKVAEEKVAVPQFRNKELHDPEYWASLIQEILKKWGWPGDRGLTVDESDLFTCWHDLLTEYCSLSFILGDHNYTTALQHIQRLATATHFAPAETGTTKVHVLGMLEAEGIPFDKLWVTGLTRQDWPMEARPNPFIPLELQRDYNLPRSSSQRELEVAKRLTANLQQGGRIQVVFSYPQRKDDSKSEISGLIADLSEKNFDVPSSEFSPYALEKFVDQTAPEINDPYVRGGTSVLKLQAQCPFKANAHVRLQAVQLEEPELILTPAIRGTIVHEILEKYWQCNREKLIQDIIKQTLEKWQLRLPQTLTISYIDIEKKRLHKLLTRWIEYENSRDPFTVIALEQKKRIDVGPISINVVLDRIDKLATGEELVIDYKTGNIQPLDPQLQIYSKYVSPYVAIAYVKPSKIELKEYEPRTDIDVEALANDFAAGVATVHPANTQVCGSCNLHALCRIYDN